MIKLGIHANYKILTQPVELERKIYVSTLAKKPLASVKHARSSHYPYEQRKLD